MFLQCCALQPITHDSVEFMNAMANQRHSDETCVRNNLDLVRFSAFFVSVACILWGKDDEYDKNGKKTRIRIFWTRAKRFAFHCVPKFKLGKLWPANLHHVKPCDQQQIDTSQHDLVAEVKEHKFKTAVLQEYGVGCMFLRFYVFFIVEFKFFFKNLQSMTSSRPLQRPKGILHAQSLM